MRFPLRLWRGELKAHGQAPPEKIPAALHIQSGGGLFVLDAVDVVDNAEDTPACDQFETALIKQIARRLARGHGLVTITPDRHFARTVPDYIGPAVNHRVNLVKRIGQSIKTGKAAKVVKTIVEEGVADNPAVPQAGHAQELSAVISINMKTEQQPIESTAIQSPEVTATPFLEDCAYHHPAAREIDFSRQVNLEEYADELSVPRKTLEGWLAAGVLCPSETKVAEKLIKIIREKENRPMGRPPETVA